MTIRWSALFQRVFWLPKLTNLNIDPWNQTLLGIQWLYRLEDSTRTHFSCTRCVIPFLLRAFPPKQECPNRMCGRLCHLCHALLLHRKLPTKRCFLHNQRTQGNSPFINFLQINALKDFPVIRFISSFDTTDATYHLKLESQSDKGHSALFETKYVVSKFYDEYGYLHRYVVRDIVEEAIQGLIKRRWSWLRYCIIHETLSLKVWY